MRSSLCVELHCGGGGSGGGHSRFVGGIGSVDIPPTLRTTSSREMLTGMPRLKIFYLRMLKRDLSFCNNLIHIQYSIQVLRG